MSQAGLSKRLLEALLAKNEAQALKIIEEAAAWLTAKQKAVNSPQAGAGKSAPSGAERMPALSPMPSSSSSASVLPTPVSVSTAAAAAAAAAAAVAVAGSAIAAPVDPDGRLYWEELVRPVVDSNGQTCLHVAAQKGLTFVVGSLLRRFVLNPNAVDAAGCTALHLACSSAAVDVARTLLQNGGAGSLAVANKDGDQPLHVALRMRHQDLVDVLVEAGADLGALNGAGVSPLHLAAETITDVEEFTQLWYRATEEQRMRLSRAGWTLVHCAAAGNNYALVQRLISQGLPRSAGDHAGCTPLHVAAARGAGPACGALLAAGCDPDVRNARGETPLHMASAAGVVRVVRLLRRHHASVDAADAEGRTPLHAAAAALQVPAARQLLESGAHAPARDAHGDTALHLAVREAAARGADLSTAALRLLDELAHELVHAGVDINAPGAQDETPLAIAAAAGALRLIRILSQHGAAPERVGHAPPRARPALHVAVVRAETDTASLLLSLGADPSVQDSAGRPALLVAMQAGRSLCVDLLLRAGADSAACTADQQPLLHWAATFNQPAWLRWLVQYGAQLDSRNALGATALHVAAGGGHLLATQALLELGANPSPTDEEGCTPLHYALRGGNEECAHALLLAGARADALSADGTTPLHDAVFHGLREAVEGLLQRGNRSMRVVNSEGWTPVHLAALRGEEAVLEALLQETGCNPNCRSTSSSTPLHLAALLGHVGCVETLLAAGADPTILDGNGYLPLHYAAQDGRDEVIGALVAHHRETLHTTSLQGETALHVAAAHGRPGAIALLAAHGADVEAKDKLGRTPLYHAAEHGHAAAVQALLRAGATVHTVDSKRNSPLHAAIGGRYMEVAVLLARRGASTTVFNSAGETPLDLATGDDMLEAVVTASEAFVTQHDSDTSQLLGDVRAAIRFADRHLAAITQETEQCHPPRLVEVPPLLQLDSAYVLSRVLQILCAQHSSIHGIRFYNCQLGRGFCQELPRLLSVFSGLTALVFEYPHGAVPADGAAIGSASMLPAVPADEAETAIHGTPRRPSGLSIRERVMADLGRPTRRTSGLVGLGPLSATTSPSPSPTPAPPPSPDSSPRSPAPRVPKLPALPEHAMSRAHGGSGHSTARFSSAAAAAAAADAAALSTDLRAPVSTPETPSPRLRHAMFASVASAVSVASYGSDASVPSSALSPRTGSARGSSTAPLHPPPGPGVSAAASRSPPVPPLGKRRGPGAPDASAAAVAPFASAESHALSRRRAEQLVEALLPILPLLPASLTSLSLCGCLSPQRLHSLAERLPDSGVRRLVLRHNHIEAAHVPLVCAAAAQLDELVLSDNRLGDSGAVALCQWLVQRPRGALIRLELADNEIGERGGLAVAEAMLRTQPAPLLALSAEAAVAEAGRVGLPSRVAELVLSRNALGWRACAALLLAAAAGRVRVLALASTQLSAEALPQLLCALRPGLPLRSLDLSGNMLDDACAAAIRHAVQGNTGLTSLSLAKNRGLAKRGVLEPSPEDLREIRQVVERNRTARRVQQAARMIHDPLRPWT